MGGFTAAVECGKAGHVIMVGECKGASSIKENLREPWHAGRLCNGSGEREGRTKMKVCQQPGAWRQWLDAVARCFCTASYLSD